MDQQIYTKNWACLMRILKESQYQWHEEVDLYPILFSPSSLRSDTAAMQRYPLIAMAGLESSTRPIHFLAVVGL